MWILLLLGGFLVIGLLPAGDRSHRLLLVLVLLVVGYRAVTRHLL